MVVGILLPLEPLLETGLTVRLEERANDHLHGNFLVLPLGRRKIVGIGRGCGHLDNSQEDQRSASVRSLQFVGKATPEKAMGNGA